jgi:hypothetical protein
MHDVSRGSSATTIIDVSAGASPSSVPPSGSRRSTSTCGDIDGNVVKH